MKAKKIFVGLLGALALGIASCGFPFDGMDSNNNSGGQGLSPYASVEELSRLAEIEGNVDWRVARFFALKSLQDFRDSNGWEGAVLSERPLIIHSQADGEPRYYEFRVIRGGSEIGAIACVAREDEGYAVQYVLPFASEIGRAAARSVAGGQGALVDAGYPGTLLVKNEATGRMARAATGEADDSEYPVELKIPEFLASLNKEELEELGITSQEEYDWIIANYLEEAEALEDYWLDIAEALDVILGLSEEEILAAFAPEISSARATIIRSDRYILPGWEKAASGYQLDGLCGPNVLALITLGLGQNSGYILKQPADEKDGAAIVAMYWDYYYL
ncbi:MAG: hypothetical protein FWE09_03090, partial [Treponema sp.]|nr:hypothetical protein [Treponema sp.]